MNYSIQRQLSIAIENQPGRLAMISKLMAEQGINIKDLCIVDNVEQGMIRLVTTEPANCKTVLEEPGLHVVEADVLVLILKDTPGQLERVCHALTDAKVNIDYAYGSEDAKEEEMRLIIRTSNTARAIAAIRGLP